MSLKVGVIGAGNVGQRLGAQLLKNKAALVKYGSRDPASEKIKAILATQTAASAGTIDEVIAWSDAIILATPSFHDDADIKAVAASLGAGIKGKVLIDATNPLSAYPGLEVRWNSPNSGGEVLAEALPDTHVFKAFNTIADEHMSAPDGSRITGEQLTMLFAGPATGRDTVEQIITGVGFKPAYVGGIRYSRNLEAIAELYVHVGVPGMGTANNWGPDRDYHFQVIRKPT